MVDTLSRIHTRPLLQQRVYKVIDTWRSAIIVTVGRSKITGFRRESASETVLKFQTLTAGKIVAAVAGFCLGRQTFFGTVTFVSSNFWRSQLFRGGHFFSC